MSNPQLHKSPQSALDAGNIPGFKTARSAVLNESNRLQPPIVNWIRFDHSRSMCDRRTCSKHSPFPIKFRKTGTFTQLQPSQPFSLFQSLEIPPCGC